MQGSRGRRWSWQIGKLFGIAIRIHVTLAALLLAFAVAAPFGDASLAHAFGQWLLVVAVFACVVIHELAHALMARHFGCATREILLLPIGGVAQMERMPQRPAQELLVALVGPATNIAIAAVLGAIIALARWPLGSEQPTLFGAVIVPLFWINITLAAFNLLPAFPMDGGRVLRAVLAGRLGRARATRVAGVVGKVLAVVFVLTGLTIGGAMLSIIGLFVWFAAEQESAMVALSTTLFGATVSDAMMRAPHVIDASTPVDAAAEQLLAGGQPSLLVSEDGHVAGVITAADLAQCMDKPSSVVGSAMRHDVPIVAPDTRLESVLEPLQRGGVVLVGDHEAIIGILTTEQLATYAALRASRARTSPTMTSTSQIASSW